MPREECARRNARLHDNRDAGAAFTQARRFRLELAPRPHARLLELGCFQAECSGAGASLALHVLTLLSAYSLDI
eukprot:3568789-Pleurochrysis_carterae.AAC.2